MTADQLEARVKAAEAFGNIKVNIIHPEGDREGVWARLATAEDAELLKRDTAGDTVNVLFLNHALIGRPSWGALVTVVTAGLKRPSVRKEDLLAQLDEQGYPKE
jgi:hypothetical protein